MTHVIHKDLFESGRWFMLSVIEQMANVGCDVDRVIRWRRSGDMQESNRAFNRALELLDFTKADPKNRDARLREICRVREALVDYFYGVNVYQTSDEFWQKYFYDFNYAAAMLRGK